MKKRFFGILACSLALTFALSGCGADTQLSFNNNVHDNTPGKSETLTYRVSSIDSDTTDDFTFNFDGTYTSTFTYYDDINHLSEDEQLKTTVQCNSLYNSLTYKNFYLLTTNLSVTATYNFPGREAKTYNDSVQTKIVFASVKDSLAPIYSYTRSKYTLIGIADNIAVSDFDDEYIVNYQKDKYTIKKVEDIGSNTTTSENEYKYTAKTLIDNNQLFFAIRNLSLAEDAGTTLPTVSIAYGEKKSLYIKKDKSTTYNLDELLYNDTTFTDETISLAKYTYYVNQTNATGSEQSVYIQTANSNKGKLQNKAYIFKIESPIYEYARNSTIGTLTYTLTSIVKN